MVTDGFLTDGFLSNPAFLQQVIDAAPIVISVKDRDGRYVLCNQYSAERHGLAPSDFLGKTVSEIFKSQAENTFRDEITAIDTHVIATGMQIPFFEETIFVKNEERRLMTSKTPLIVSLHLNSQPQIEAPAGCLVQVPGEVRRDGRVAGEGDGHRRAKLDFACRHSS